MLKQTSERRPVDMNADNDTANCCSGQSVWPVQMKLSRPSPPASSHKEPQASLYQEWFESTPQSRDNLLLRAFSLNQDRIAREVAAVAESTGDLKLARLPWDKLFSLYNEASRQIGADTLDAFMAIWCGRRWRRPPR